MQHVPYKGTALAAPDLKNGQIAMMIDNIVSAIPFMKSGMEQALAVTSAKRSEILPNLPTVAESGVPGYESTAYFGIFGPAGIAPAVVARLNGEVDRIVKSADTKAKLLDLGAEPVGGPSENLAKAQREDFAKWSKVIKEAGVKPQ
jgi:tripartite-type tricarboxylate transporter receptor subunit TctC